MAIQLTQEQEHRLTEVVRSGAYPSVEEALEAAVAGVEDAENLGFEGSEEELDRLLMEGIESGGAVEVNEEFWGRITAETDRMLSEYQVGKLQR